MVTRPHPKLVNDMLEDALDMLRENERPLIHSVRGGHYRWPGWLYRINTSGLKRSMSQKGCLSGNAACEGFFGGAKMKCAMAEIERARRRKNLSAPWTGTYAGITRSELKYHWVQCDPTHVTWTRP